MSSWVNILAGAILLAAGAILSYLGLWLKGRGLRKARDLEAEAILTKARNAAEIIVRDARLAASEDARKLLEETEAAFAARRAERAELEKRLSEREALINSQLERIVDAEKTLAEQKLAFRQRTDAVEKVERSLDDLIRQNREALQRAAGISPEEAKAEFLKRVEQEALRDAWLAEMWAPCPEWRQTRDERADAEARNGMLSTGECTDVQNPRAVP